MVYNIKEMAKQYYKILLYSLYIGAAVCLVYLVWSYSLSLKDKSRLAPKYYDSIIVNENTSYTALRADVPAYEIPFLRIRSIGFKSDKDYLVLKFQLAGTLPEKASDLPSYGDDKIADASYSLTLDENYFDYSGNKNPGGPEAELKIDFYQKKVSGETNKIQIEGELIKGGPGYDYFVIRYPYSQLLIHQNSAYIVFTAEGFASSNKYQDGVSKSIFKNTALAATQQNNQEVMLDLSLKDLIY